MGRSILEAGALCEAGRWVVRWLGGVRSWIGCWPGVVRWRLTALRLRGRSGAAGGRAVFSYAVVDGG